MFSSSCKLGCLSRYSFLVLLPHEFLEVLRHAGLREEDAVADATYALVALPSAAVRARRHCCRHIGLEQNGLVSGKKSATLQIAYL